VLTLSNGDHLAGKLLSEANRTVTFHSDAVGDLTLTWDKIKSIQTAEKFAVIQQEQRVSRKTANSEVLQGIVVAEEGKVWVNTGAEGASKDIAQPAAQYPIDQATYQKTVNGHPGWGHGWAGVLSAGVMPSEGKKFHEHRRCRGDAGEHPALRSTFWICWLCQM
jgi:hypothetical protein